MVRVKTCRACGKSHNKRLGISNDLGFFCSFIHAINYERRVKRGDRDTKASSGIPVSRISGDRGFQQIKGVR